MTKIEEISKCRACYSKNLIPILSLGNQYVTNFTDSSEEKGTRVPLDLVLCGDKNCGTLQLRHNAPPKLMWNDHYGYKSGINRLIRENLREIVEKSERLVHLSGNDLVLDIGCNDGTMLGYYSNPSLRRIGFEPSANVAREAREKGIFVVEDFFGRQKFNRAFPKGKSKIITAISMFYDLENPNKFLEDIVNSLDKNGLFVIQQNYLMSMLKQNAFDNICHEHRGYYSLTSLRNLLEKRGLEIFDVELNEINGGSIRTYIKLRDNKQLTGFKGSNERMEKLLEEEETFRLNTPKPYQEFAQRIENIKNSVMRFLQERKKEGKVIYGCGASTRGNTTLQYFGADNQLISAIGDKNPAKFGKRTPGTGISIISPEEVREKNPDYQLVLIWHLFDTVKEDERDYLNRGGKFVIPLPKFKIIGKD